MAITYALINKECLTYICEGKHVSKQYIIERAKIRPEKWDSWIDPSDKSLPTIKQAKTIARFLHVPFAALYMNASDIPLQKIPRFTNMRVMQEGVADDSALSIAICDVLSEREFLIKANKAKEEEIPSFKMKAPDSNDIKKWVETIREDFGITLEQQINSGSPRQLYLYLRDCIEIAGVCIQCFKDVPIEVARGIAIFFDTLPIIGINDDDRPPAKAFSIIHELVHLYKRVSTTCNDLSNNAAFQEEVFCNAVAGELLVPESALAAAIIELNIEYPYSVNDIKQLADYFSVSREVITRRMLDLGNIVENEYDIFYELFRREIELEKERKRIAREKGLEEVIPRLVYRDAFDRTSTTVSKALYNGYVEGELSKRDIANHVGIAQRHVDKYLLEVAKWNS